MATANSTMPTLRSNIFLLNTVGVVQYQTARRPPAQKDSRAAGEGHSTCSEVSLHGTWENSAVRNERPRATYLPSFLSSMASISRKLTPRLFIDFRKDSKSAVALARQQCLMSQHTPCSHTHTTAQPKDTCCWPHSCSEGGKQRSHPFMSVSYTHLTLPTTPYV